MSEMPVRSAGSQGHRLDDRDRTEGHHSDVGHLESVATRKVSFTPRLWPVLRLAPASGHARLADLAKHGDIADPIPAFWLGISANRWPVSAEMHQGANRQGLVDALGVRQTRLPHEAFQYCLRFINAHYRSRADTTRFKPPVFPCQHEFRGRVTVACVLARKILIMGGTVGRRPGAHIPAGGRLRSVRPPGSGSALGCWEMSRLPFHPNIHADTVPPMILDSITLATSGFYTKTLKTTPPKPRQLSENTFIDSDTNVMVRRSV